MLCYRIFDMQIYYRIHPLVPEITHGGAPEVFLYQRKLAKSPYDLYSVGETLKSSKTKIESITKQLHNKSPNNTYQIIWI